MISFAHIQSQLREEFNDLCAAFAAEQEWLEEGRSCDADAAQLTPIASGKDVEAVAEVRSE